MIHDGTEYDGFSSCMTVFYPIFAHDSPDDMADGTYSSDLLITDSLRFDDSTQNRQGVRNPLPTQT